MMKRIDPTANNIDQLPNHPALCHWNVTFSPSTLKFPLPLGFITMEV